MIHSLKRAFAFLPLTLSIQVSLSAQTPPDTLSGIVFDEVTGSPVTNASVDLIYFDGGSRFAGTHSDEGGRFVLSVTAGHYWLVASHPGFATSPPREVVWDGDSERVHGILLRLRTLDQEVLAVRARGDAEADGARVIGQLLDQATGAAVSEAEVDLVASGLRTLSDRNGMFVFPEAPPGEEVLRIRHVAYGEQTKELLLEPGKAYRIDGRLSLVPIEIEGIEVRATTRDWFRRMDGLRWRMELGWSSDYILADDLERRGYPPLADALREVPGIRVRGTGLRRRITIRRCSAAANAGEPVIYLDGIKVHRPGTGTPMYVLWEVASMDLEAIEVYKRACVDPCGIQRFRCCLWRNCYLD